MKKIMIQRIWTTACVAIFMFSGIFLCGAKELSSIQIKKIERAIANLEDPGRGAQRKGYKEIRYIGETTTPYLVKELKNKTIKFESTVLICDLLGEFKAKEAVPNLIYNLKNKSFTVRAAACKALGNIGDPAAVEPLIGMLGSEDFHVRAAAINGLVNFDNENITLKVVGSLKDENEGVRRAAVTLLDDKRDPATAGMLREALQQDNVASVRMIAARALGGIKDAKAVDILMESAIEDISEGVRQESVIALGKVGDKKAVVILIEAVGDDYKDVQIAAAGSLAELTGEDFGRDQDEWAKWHAGQ